MTTRSNARKGLEQDARKDGLEVHQTPTPKKVTPSTGNPSEATVRMTLTPPAKIILSPTNESPVSMPSTPHHEPFSPTSSVEKKLDSLQLTMVDLTLTLSQLRDDVKGLKVDSKQHETQLDDMQTKILDKQSTFMEQVNKKIDDKIAHVEEKITLRHRDDDKIKHDVDLLRGQLVSESYKTSLLQSQLDQLSEEIG